MWVIPLAGLPLAGKDIINACYANYYTNSGVHDFNVSSSVRPPIFAQNRKLLSFIHGPKSDPTVKHRPSTWLP